MMADDDDKDNKELNPDAIDDLLEADWKDEDEAEDKMHGDAEEEESY